MSKVKHPGFAKVQANIAKKEGVSKGSAGAILASATRKAGSSAKAKNPMLKKVLPTKKQSSFEKKDKSADKKMGVKESSKKDTKIDTKQAKDSIDSNFIKSMSNHIKSTLSKNK